MNLTMDSIGDIRLFRPDGRLDSTTMQQVEAPFLDTVKEGGKLFVFDLSKLEYISSAGLRVMLMAVKKTRAAGGKIALFGLSDNVMEVFQISGFTAIFSIFDTEDEAVRFTSS